MDRIVRMIDETEGEIKEVLINLTPASYEAVEEIIDALPEARFYLAHGYTMEDLYERLNNFPYGHKIDEKFFTNMESFADIDSEFALVFAEPPAISKWQIEQLKKLVEKNLIPEGTRYDIGWVRKQLEHLERTYGFYLRNPDFQDYVHYFILYQNARNLKGSRSHLESLKSKSPERIDLIPIDGAISSFSRDRIIAGQREDGKVVLVQGKIAEEFGSPSLGNFCCAGDLKISEQCSRQAGFGFVPNTDIKMKLYEGGDIRASSKKVFVGPHTFSFNMKSMTLNALANEIEHLSGRIGRGNKFFIGGQYKPHIHLDLYFTPISDEVVAVGDITPCIEVLRKKGALNEGHNVGYRSEQPFLDKIALQFRESGFAVERIPLYFWQGIIESDMACRSFANEVRSGEKMVTASFGDDELDEKSSRVFEKHGYKLHLLKSMESIYASGDEIIRQYRGAGARCFVNVLSKSYFNLSAHIQRIQKEFNQEF